ncbi:MAG: ABC transporter permease [Firmicutes bacterium]|nr:ABC transporter permease [Bacillota bacterium]
MSGRPATAAPGHEQPAPASAERRRVWRALRGNALAMTGLLIIAFFAFLAVFGPYLAPYSPTEPDLDHILQPPGGAHLLGTDDTGMDILSRVLFGARIDFLSALLIVAVSMALGTAIGTVAGWLGGFWDDVLMRMTDMFLAFPSLILAMAIAAVLKPSLTNALLAISVTYWPVYARLARGQILSLKEREFVEAARAVGLGGARIVLRHVLPNAFAPVLIQATLDMGAVLLIAAGLSFIGFGAQPPTPEWGRMVSDGRSYLQTQWWISTFPAIAILLLALGFNFLGDALRDLFDPRSGR